jgi:hypothetical protein
MGQEIRADLDGRLLPLITDSLVPILGWLGVLASAAVPSVAGVIAMAAVRKLR